MSGETGEPLSGPVQLAKEHERGAFSCGSPELDDHLKRYAWQNQRRGAGVTYVATRGRRVVGYYTLAAGSVSPDEPPARMTRGLRHYPVPVVLLARLAVDDAEKGAGLGAALLNGAMRRSAQAAETIGGVALLVHAKDEAAAAFYRHFDFEPSMKGALHLYLPIAAIRALLG